MTYEDVHVKIGDDTILATSASISFSCSESQSFSLGVQGGSFSSRERPEGNISINYYLQNSDSSIRNLTGITPVYVKIGDTKAEAYLSSYRLSIKPFSLVEGAVDFVFFKKPVIETAEPAIVDSDTALVNGANSDITYVDNFNTKKVSIDLSISQSINPVYDIGISYPSTYIRSAGNLEVTIEGEDSASFVSWPCEEDASVTINLSSCEEPKGSIVLENLKTREITFSASEGSKNSSKITLGCFF